MKLCSKCGEHKEIRHKCKCQNCGERASKHKHVAYAQGVGFPVTMRVCFECAKLFK